MGRGPRLHGTQGARPVAELGAVSGFLLKLIRGSISHRQIDLAEALSVDVTTIQGWEGGRRPLTALKAFELVRLKHKLTSLGASPIAIALLPEAIEADAILSLAAQAGDDPMPKEEHPLAAAVHRRSLVSLITWPFTGITPKAIRHLQKSVGRGPITDRPPLDAVATSRFFDQMLVTADAASGTTATLLRRQATYLAGFDQRPTSAQWLTREQRKIATQPSDGRDLPAMILGRSAVLALARQGDAEPVKRYIERDLDNDERSLANLTYWAYWLGEIPETYADDGDMVRQGAVAWGGHRLLKHLLGHLSDPTNVELNIHSLWTLILARPGLLDRDADARATAAINVEKTLAVGDLSARARHELTSIQCAVKLAGR